VILYNLGCDECFGGTYHHQLQGGNLCVVSIQNRVCLALMVKQKAKYKFCLISKLFFAFYKNIALTKFAEYLSTYCHIAFQNYTKWSNYHSCVCNLSGHPSAAIGGRELI
jgi:hypothetical protein